MNARAYYNENDEFAAQWLRSLITAGLIASGDVDTRSIVDVRADDLAGYTQCHFFAGIGGWPLAARLAGWPDSRQLWSGSCPCQPFSKANIAHRQRRGRDDERHLLPEWLRLIEAEHPPVVVGEQVKDAIAFGWLDEAFDAMERNDYSCWSIILPALCVGSPQERERLWFICDANGVRHQRVSEPRTNVATSGRVIPWSSAVRTSGSYRGKAWFSEPGLCRLADGLSPRVADVLTIKGFGNAIVPQVGAEILATYLDCEAVI